MKASKKLEKILEDTVNKASKAGLKKAQVHPAIKHVRKAKAAKAKGEAKKPIA